MMLRGNIHPVRSFSPLSSPLTKLDPHVHVLPLSNPLGRLWCQLSTADILFPPNDIYAVWWCIVSRISIHVYGL